MKIDRIFSYSSNNVHREPGWQNSNYKSASEDNFTEIMEECGYSIKHEVYDFMCCYTVQFPY